MTLQQHQDLADRLLTPLWRSLSDKYKQKYARNIWTQFEDMIRSSAYTSDLGRFLDTLCRRADIEIRSELVRPVVDFIQSVPARETLNALREDTTLLVLLVRADNDKRREQCKKQKPEE